MKNVSKYVGDIRPLAVILVLSIALVVLAHSTSKGGFAITVQPEDVTVGAGGEVATVTVEAKGEDLTYQWFLKNRDAAEFEKSETDGNTCSIEMTKESNGCQLYCLVTDKNGKTVQSNTVTVAIAGPVIEKQPENVTVAKAGDSAKTKVVASGEELTYQWYVKDPSDAEFQKSKVKKDTYHVELVESKNGRQLYCEVTDKYGSTVRTDTVTFSIQK